jgi:hypothetical protein
LKHNLNNLAIPTILPNVGEAGNVTVIAAVEVFTKYPMYQQILLRAEVTNV